jgi:MFS family permease
VFTLARFSEAFLLLRAQEVGFELAFVPVVMVVMNVVYTLVAAPAGRLSDSVDRRWLMGAGLIVLIIADLVLAQFNNAAGVVIGSALWGLHMGLSQGALSALVADTAPERLRGTAFGVFHFVTGIALLVASAFAGWAWSVFGSQATFLSGALFAFLALVGLFVAIRR